MKKHGLNWKSPGHHCAGSLIIAIINSNRYNKVYISFMVIVYQWTLPFYFFNGGFIIVSSL